MKKHHILVIGSVILFVLIIAIVIKRRGITNTVMSKIFNKQLTKNFNLSELLVTSTGLPNIPNDAEIANLELLAKNVLQPARDLLGVPMPINSAFRSEPVNKKVGGVKNSQHRLGLAGDFTPKGMKIEVAMRKLAESSIPYDQLIIETGSKGERWIHISYNPKGGRKQALVALYNPAKGKMEYSKFV